MITDTHAHLFWDTFQEDQQEVLQRANEAGVTRMIIVGTDPESSEAAFELCSQHDNLYPTAGIHPHDAVRIAEKSALERIEALCRRPECVAVGETGLDLFKEFSPRDKQLEGFRWHLDLARKIDKPVVVHCRDAHEDTIAAISEFTGVRGVMHCFTMGEEELAPYLDAGFYISFSGIVTFPKSDANRGAAAKVPLNRLLVETDCPFLAPQGHRGKRNEPALVKVVLEEVARLHNLPPEELAEITSENASRLFGL